MRSVCRVVPAVVAVILLASCGSDPESVADPAKTVTVSATPSTTAVASPSTTAPAPSASTAHLGVPETCAAAMADWPRRGYPLLGYTDRGLWKRFMRSFFDAYEVASDEAKQVLLPVANAILDAEQRAGRRPKPDITTMFNETTAFLELMAEVLRECATR